MPDDNNSTPKLASFPIPPTSPLPPLNDSSQNEPLEPDEIDETPIFPSTPITPPASSTPPPPLPPLSPTPPEPQEDSFKQYPDTLSNTSPQLASNPTNQEDYFTDPVAPEIHDPLPDQAPPSFTDNFSPTPLPTTTPETPPSFSPLIFPPAPPAIIEPTPATLPNTSGSSSKIFTFILIILVISAIAAAAAFLIQYQKNKTSLDNAESTKERQELTPSPTAEISTTPESTNSANNYPQITVIQEKPKPTLPPAGNYANAFTNINEILDLAHKKSASAQLILITATNLQPPYQRIYKYWFRMASNQKVYFYVSAEDGKDLALYDQQVVVTPDNNIPSLNDDVLANKLGIDLADAMTLAQTEIIDNTNLKSQTSEISAKFIKTKIGSTYTPIWQLTYKFSSQSTPVVIQIDSLKKTIIFTNIKYTKPIATPTKTPSPTPTI